MLSSRSVLQPTFRNQSHRKSGGKMRNRIPLLAAITLALTLTAIGRNTMQAEPGSLNGTVKDPAGAVIVGAQVSIRNEATGETRSASTNNEGRFKIDSLAPGSYSISVAQTGFKSGERKVVIEPKRAATIEIRLEVAAPRERVDVGAKGAIAPNSEPSYRQLRDAEALETYTVSNLALE